MNFFLNEKTQLNYKRNLKISGKIAFNLIEFLKKPVKRIRKINPLGELCRKLLLIKLNNSNGTILFGLQVKEMLRFVETSYLDVERMHALTIRRTN